MLKELVDSKILDHASLNLSISKQGDTVKIVLTPVHHDGHSALPPLAISGPAAKVEAKFLEDVVSYGGNVDDALKSNHDEALAAIAKSADKAAAKLKESKEEKPKEAKPAATPVAAKPVAKPRDEKKSEVKAVTSDDLEDVLNDL